MKYQGGKRKDGWRSVAARLAAAVALLAMSAGCSGCLWLAVPSLAYQGYKYESGHHQSSQAKPPNSSPPPSQSSPPPSQDDIE